MNREKSLPYGKQEISRQDIDAVCDVLRSDYLTTGPMVPEFEKRVSQYCNTRFGVAVNSGTAGLHAAMYAAGIGPGDEVIVPPMTFAASANAVVYQKGVPVFCDIDPDTLLIDPKQVIKKITPKTKAIVAVDYAGQMCDYDELLKLARDKNLTLISDACHSLGGRYKERPSGSCADLSIFSFHPVKQITTGEGGMVVTDDKKLYQKMIQFRNHGINKDFRLRQKADSWYYEIDDLGFNYRLTDFQCALGISQMKNLDAWIEKRNQIARFYDQYFKDQEIFRPLNKMKDCFHAYHLYVIKMDFKAIGQSKQEVFSFFKQNNIHLNVHYIPVHLHPYYINNFNTYKGLCPVSENAYEDIFSIPIFPGMSEEDVNYVCSVFDQLML